MSLGKPIILSSDSGQADSGLNNSSSNQKRFSRRQIMFGAIFLLVFLLILLVIFFIFKKSWFGSSEKISGSSANLQGQASSTVSANLPNFGTSEEGLGQIAIASSSSSNLSVEYLSFQDFYEAPNNVVETRLNDYKLPLNVKIDVMNYYDVSRKLNLDGALDSLNTNGLVIINNPWTSASDFYSLYGNINKQQLPILLTSDFIIYQYQNILKKVFKDVEQNVFYDNLWDINKEMYTVARERYEARLAAIGDVNDALLEGERLETVFFAVALELMKPASNQISSKNSAEANGLFTVAEADRFYFTLPTYLSDDVKAELKLIREAKALAKSPVFLYQRNYNDFIVPGEYLSDAKLRNFYLTTKWLNSVFPLNYRDKDCPACLLDQTDWRINLTAASLLAKDFSSSVEIKSKWARIYKVMSFFKGLQEDWNYLHYRDTLVAVFGSDYKIEDIFGSQNTERDANLEKLRSKLLGNSFSEIAGYVGQDDQSARATAGLKILAENYWPNSYIFKRLVSPSVGSYLGSSTPAMNITACSSKQSVTPPLRCNGIALDVINLVHPITGNDYFLENSKYDGYSQAAQGIRDELTKNSVWHWSNYWTTLRLVQSYLDAGHNKLPTFTQSTAWQDKELKTAAGAWINLQLPLEKFTGNTTDDNSLNNSSRLNDYSYIEPNIDVINEMAANSQMLLRMFSALQLDLDVTVALQDLRNFSSNLQSLRAIILKELSGEKLATADNETIAKFISAFKLTSPVTTKQIAIKINSQKNVLREDLSRFKLLVLVHQEGDNKIFSIGPVWNYQESR